MNYSYSYSYNIPEEQALQILIPIIVTVCAVAAIITIYCAVITCLLFRKMGRPAWAAIIPFYGSWVLHEELFGKGWYMFYSVLGVIPVVGSLLVLAFGWYAQLRLAKSFGHDIPFSIGLTLASPIFLSILAFNKDTYRRLLPFDYRQAFNFEYEDEYETYNVQ